MRKLRHKEGNDLLEATLLVAVKAELQSPRTDPKAGRQCLPDWDK